MANWSDLILYGSDTDANTEYPQQSVVAGYSDVKKIEKKILGLNIKPQYIDKEKNNLENLKSSQSVFRYEFELKLTAIDYPTSTIDLESYFFQDVLSLKYHYLYWGSNYKIVPYGILNLTPTRVSPIAIGELSIANDYELGKKYFILPCTFRYP